MTPETQLPILAKLDGWKSGFTVGFSRYPAYKHGDGRLVAFCNMPRYLHDFNVIIALIRKQKNHVQNGVWERIDSYKFQITPALMAQALLRELELWTEK